MNDMPTVTSESSAGVLTALAFRAGGSPAIVRLAASLPTVLKPYSRTLKIPTEILEHGLPTDVLPSVEKACHQAVLSKLIPMLGKHPVIARMEFRALLLTRDEDDELKA